MEYQPLMCFPEVDDDFTQFHITQIKILSYLWDKYILTPEIFYLYTHFVISTKKKGEISETFARNFLLNKTKQKRNRANLYTFPLSTQCWIDGSEFISPDGMDKNKPIGIEDRYIGNFITLSHTAFDCSLISLSSSPFIAALMHFLILCFSIRTLSIDEDENDFFSLFELMLKHCNIEMFDSNRENLPREGCTFEPIEYNHKDWDAMRINANFCSDVFITTHKSCRSGRHHYWYVAIFEGCLKKSAQPS